MDLVLMGQKISEEAQAAGQEAIALRRFSFTAHPIANAIQPYIAVDHSRWEGVTTGDVALAVANELLWRRLRAGSITRGMRIFGQQYWRPVPPVRPIRSGGA